MRHESPEQTLARFPDASADPLATLRPDITLITGDGPTGPRSAPPGPPPPSILPAVAELPALSATLGGVDDLTTICELGAGGMGRVELAIQQSLRRRVAVKTARASAAFSAALVREAVVNGMLEHPNIPPVHSLGRSADGRVMMVMKNIEGVPWSTVLRDRTHPLRQRSPLFAGDELSANVQILAQVCNALEYAHANGIIHRDVKPANVMLGLYGEVYLIDWGVAFNTRWGLDTPDLPLAGTPAYMAPEAFRSAPPGPHTDVYLLGATLLEVLTGAPPHQAPDLLGVIARAMSTEPRALPADVPEALASLCLRALAFDVAARTATVREFREGLSTYLAHRTSIALCREASDRLVELRAALRGLDTTSAEAAARISRLQLECRFGFAQALREWPGNAEASAGAGVLCRALARHELDLGNPRGARAHLADLAGGDAALEEAITALEARLRAQAEAERLRREREREIDVRSSRREILKLTGALAAIAAAVGLWRALNPAVEADLARRHVTLLLVWAGTVFSFVAVVVLVSRARGRDLARELRRPWLQLIAAKALAMGVGRVAMLALLPGAAPTFAGELSMDVSLAVLATTLGRRFAWIALPALLALAGICVEPALASPLYSVAIACELIIASWATSAHSRERDAADARRPTVPR